jgi:hypothetical protein
VLHNRRCTVMYKRKATAMMGSKQRHFAPLVHVSLEELVPQDHFYRQCAVSVHMRLLQRSGRLRAYYPPRTSALPGVERQRGNEHSGKAAQPEGM